MHKFEPFGSYNRKHSKAVTDCMANVPIGKEFFVVQRDAKNIRVRAHYYAKKRGIKIRVLKADGGYVVRAYAADGAQNG